MWLEGPSKTSRALRRGSSIEANARDSRPGSLQYPATARSADSFPRAAHSWSKSRVPASTRCARRCCAVRSRLAGTASAASARNPASAMRLSPSSSLRMAAARCASSPAPSAVAMRRRGAAESSAAIGSAGAAASGGGLPKRRDSGFARCLNRMEECLCWRVRRLYRRLRCGRSLDILSDGCSLRGMISESSEVSRQIAEHTPWLELRESGTGPHIPIIGIRQILDLHPKRRRGTQHREPVSAAQEECRQRRILGHIIYAGRSRTKVKHRDIRGEGGPSGKFVVGIDRPLVVRLTEGELTDTFSAEIRANDSDFAQ